MPQYMQYTPSIVKGNNMSIVKSIYKIHQKTPINSQILTHLIYTTTMYNNMWTIRSQKKVAKMAQDDPDKLVWVRKHFPDAEWDEYYLYRRIPEYQAKNARKGGWILVDNDL